MIKKNIYIYIYALNDQANEIDYMSDVRTMILESFGPRIVFLLEIHPNTKLAVLIVSADCHYE